ncbi:MAG TPA: hypothetical protein VID24_02165 [Candidatus Eremiobacteraceae bacterium]
MRPARVSWPIIVVVAIAASLGGAVCAGPARALIEGAMSCSLSTPCLEWDNSSSGDAIKGVSTKGNALHGQTKFKSAGKTSGKSGVLGEDLSTSGNLDSGVLGSSTNGAGVTGISSTYNAVQGLSAGSTGVYGQTGAAAGFGAAGRNTSSTHDDNGAGVLADGGPQDDAIHAFANGSGANAIYAFSASGLSFVGNQGAGDQSAELLLQGNGTSHDLFDAFGDGGAGFNLNSSGSVRDLSISQVPATFVAAPGNRNEAMDLYGGSTGNASAGFVLFDSSGNAQAILDDEGNAYINGLLYSSGSCHAGCLVGNKRVASVGEFGAVGTEPTIEDNGEAQLAEGRAYVKLDPRFANVIDQTSQYLVSVTPEGDCRGLYVADRSSDGFTVRELGGGRANVAFEYRIVAKRFGVHASRLPFMTVHHGAKPHITRRNVSNGAIER